MELSISNINKNHFETHQNGKVAFVDAIQKKDKN